MDRFIILLDPSTTTESCVVEVFHTLDDALAFTERYLKRRSHVIWELTASGIRHRSPLADSVLL